MPKKQDTLTEYQSQYKAKQQIKYFYGGISETSLRRLVKTRPAGHPAICELEKRLDVVLFRLGFASTIFEARSLIKGGSIKLNDIRGSATQSRELLNKTQVQVGSKITIDTTKAGWKTTYLAKIQHLRQNLFKLPTHLIVAPLKPVQAGGVLNPRQLEGYFIKEPVESEVILPYNFPLNKFKYFLHSKK